MMRFGISIVAFLAASQAAQAQDLHVITDIAPIQGLVMGVLGDHGKAEVLLEPGASAHHFALKPSAMRGIQNADLVIHVSEDLTPWISGALKNRQGPVLELLDSPNTHLQTYQGDAHDDHDHGHDHDGNHDPHAWLDPSNAVAWTQNIADQLIALSPENAQYYQDNANLLMAKITAADENAQVLLHSLQDRAFLTFHDAFGYFTHHFGLNAKGAIALGDGSSPGAKHMAQLRGQITEAEIICLFPEAGHDPKLAQQLSEGTSVKLGAPLDPEGTNQGEITAEFYPNFISQTAQTFADCLQ